MAPQTATAYADPAELEDAERRAIAMLLEVVAELYRRVIALEEIVRDRAA